MKTFNYIREKGKPRPGWTYRGARRNAIRSNYGKARKAARKAAQESK